MAKYIKCEKSGGITLRGRVINESDYYQLPETEYIAWASDSSVISALTSNNIAVSDRTDETNDIEDTAKALAFLRDEPARDANGALLTSEPPPFGSKKLLNGKSLFRRIHGLELQLDGTANPQTVVFMVPYISAKITSTEVVGAVLGDAIDFRVLDTAAGTISTIPNHPLNQFGHSVYPSQGRYEQKSEYDADLFLGLQLEVTVTPGDTTARSIYFNFVLHEIVG